MNNSLDWDDLRFVLAVAEAGSLAGAGLRLGHSHATVYRRLNAIEERMGVALFVRDRRGYGLTPAGETMADAARVMAEDIATVERAVIGGDLKPAGIIRVTTTDTLLAGLFAPMFTRFRAAHPDIVLDVIIDNRVLDLSRREADIALRPALSPAETLIGRKLGRIEQAVYGAAGLTEGANAEKADWIGPGTGMSYSALNRWMEECGHADRCGMRIDTVEGMLAAARAGAGLAVLPCYLAGSDRGLRQVGPPVAELGTDLWLLTHPDLRRTARIRAFMDYLSGEVPYIRTALAGKV